MKKLLLFTAGLLFFATASRAQSSGDVSIGYSYFRLGGSGGLNQNGISGSVAFNPNRWLGLVADVGGYHASPSGISVNTYTYLFGPRFTLRNPTHISPFVQGLVGGSHISAGGGGSTNQFSYLLGGGVDFGLLPHLSVRPQVDYVGLDTPGGHTNCVRISGSLVVHF